MLASKQSTNLYDIYLMLYVQSCTPDDGRKDRPKHVEWYPTNLKNCAPSWSYNRSISRYTVPWHNFRIIHLSDLQSPSRYHRKLRSTNSGPISVFDGICFVFFSFVLSFPVAHFRIPKENFT